MADKSTRRSVYRRVLRNSPDEVLHAFDVPDHISHMPQRSVTTTPTQSLLLLNSGWIRARAFALAKRLAKRHPGEVGAQLQSAHELALGQAISAPDRADARAFIEQNSDGNAAADQAALAEYCHVLLNANGFLYVD